MLLVLLSATALLLGSHYHTPTNVGESYADRDTQQLRSYLAPDTTFSFAEERGVDLQLSGHTHGGQMFPFGLLTRALWNGFDRGLHRIGGLSLRLERDRHLGPARQDR